MQFLNVSKFNGFFLTIFGVETLIEIDFKASHHKVHSKHESVIFCEMVDNMMKELISNHSSASSDVPRFLLSKFDIVYQFSKLKSLNHSLGRAAHIALLYDELVAQRLVFSISRYFIP
eukprot:Sdes_comp20321_c0_seq1m13978